jgi:hypothetical protein
MVVLLYPPSFDCQSAYSLAPHSFGRYVHFPLATWREFAVMPVSILDLLNERNACATHNPRAGSEMVATWFYRQNVASSWTPPIRCIFWFSYRVFPRAPRIGKPLAGDVETAYFNF